MHKFYERLKNTKWLRKFIQIDIWVSDFLEGRFRKHKRLQWLLFKYANLFFVLVLVITGALIYRYGYIRILDLLIFLAVAYVLERFVKPFFGRLRPFFLDGALPIQYTKNYSFPSTHSFMAGWVVGYWWLLGLPFAEVITVLGVIVALSRVLLNIHFVSDVICGFLIGIGISLIANIV